jgi:hypothetical protein
MMARLSSDERSVLVGRADDPRAARIITVPIERLQEGVIAYDYPREHVRVHWTSLNTTALPAACFSGVVDSLA